MHQYPAIVCAIEMVQAEAQTTSGQGTTALDARRVQKVRRRKTQPAGEQSAVLCLHQLTSSVHAVRKGAISMQSES